LNISTGDNDGGDGADVGTGVDVDVIELLLLAA
jgi:hypothetical protein